MDSARSNTAANLGTRTIMERETWDKANLVRITLLCMAAYAIVAGFVSLLGTLVTPAASHFDQPVPAAASRFGYLSSGIAFGSVLGLFFFERCNLRRAFLGCQGTVALALGVIVLLDRWSVMPPLLFAAGSAAGLGLCAAAVCLALSYQGRRRAVMLLSTDICFAITGVVLSPVAAWLIGGGARWDSVYLLIAVAASSIVIGTAFSHFPATAREAGLPAASGSLPLGAALCGAGLLCYLLGQVSMLIWVPNLMQAEGGAELSGAAAAISRYWIGMVLGQLLAVFLLTRFSARQLLSTAIASSMVCALPLCLPLPSAAFPVLLLVLGLCNAGILKLTLAFASDLAIHPQRVITALLFCGSLGQATAPFASAGLVEALGMRAGLQLSSVCYVFAGVFIGLAIARHRAVKESIT